jgi:hypothetical protein
MRLSSLVVLIALIIPSIGYARPNKGPPSPPLTTPNEAALEADHGAMMQADTNAVSAYLRSDFTICDAKVLATAWGTNLHEAKVSIGQKITNMGRGFAATAVDGNREAAIQRGLQCNYQDEGLSYEDAARLATQWNQSIPEAKATLENKLVHGWAGPYLNSANEAVNDHHEAPPDDSLAQFFQSQYRYCDAQLLSHSWGVGVSDAKWAIGYKVRTGIDVDSYLSDARKQRTIACPFHENFSMEEAQKMSAVWGIGLSDAKVRAEQKLAAGNHAGINFALEQHGPR